MRLSVSLLAIAWILALVHAVGQSVLYRVRGDDPSIHLGNSVTADTHDRIHRWTETLGWLPITPERRRIRAGVSKEPGGMAEVLIENVGSGSTAHGGLSGRLRSLPTRCHERPGSGSARSMECQSRSRF